MDYLKSTCLERFARAVRAGYLVKSRRKARDEYHPESRQNEYSRFSEETRWEEELYSLCTFR